MFSVITVCKNAEKTIPVALESLLSQTFQDFEYVVVDGKSVDSTVEILKKYESLFQGRLKWISEEDDGIYDAMNKGIRMASGKLVGILGSDDSYLPTTLEIVKNAYADGNFRKVVYGLANQILNGVHIKTEGICSVLLSKHMICHQSLFIPMQLHKEFGLYDVQYKIVADYDFLLRLADNDIQFENCNVPLANYNVDGISSNQLILFPEHQKVRFRHGIITKKQYNKIMFKFWTSKFERVIAFLKLLLVKK